jgi:molecular chaperone GrpE
MTAEEKQPIPPEDAYPELIEEELVEDAELEELILEASEAGIGSAPAGPAPSSAPAAEESGATLSKVQHELEVARQQLREKEEAYVRLYADFDNFRRRTQREKEEASARDKQKFILEILPIVDNFERAQQQVKIETDREREIHNSYQSVYRLLVEALKKMGVSRMKSVGQPFDPNLHDAIARQPSQDYPEDTVVMEYQPGYRLGDLVIRHAMVMVAAPAEGEGPGFSAATAPGGTGEMPHLFEETEGSVSPADPTAAPEEG